MYSENDTQRENLKVFKEMANCLAISVCQLLADCNINVFRVWSYKPQKSEFMNCWCHIWPKVVLQKISHHLEFHVVAFYQKS